MEGFQVSEMVERVARAIVAKMGAQTGREPPGDAAMSKTACDVARAAIEAMREPTEEMVTAPGVVAWDFGEIWRVMIDAALAG